MYPVFVLVVVLVDASNIYEWRKLSPEILKVLHFHRNKNAILVFNKVTYSLL